VTDLSTTIAPKSDQLNADDLIPGPITITITGVRQGSSPEQPIAVEHDSGRPWMPCKSMRRVLVHVWGADGNRYVGRSLTLYRDPAVKFGGMAVGGIRISHMSDMAAAVTVALTETRASRKPFTVKPLVIERQQPTQDVAAWGRKLAADLDACTDQAGVDAIATRPDVIEALQTAPDRLRARINELIAAAIKRVAPDDGWPGPETGEEL
jgi:hypothetical protein